MTQPIKQDVIIIGGGMGGMTTALGLAHIGLSVAVVERFTPNTLMDDPFDGRASAIAFSSSNYLKALGLWGDLDPVSQPILEIRVSDGPSLMHLHFDHADLEGQGGTGQGATGQGATGPLGYMVENRHLRRALYKAEKKCETLSVFAPNSVTAIKRSPGFVRVDLDNGDTLEASLLLGIDGRSSLVRTDLGIEVTSWSYNQSGIVAALAHEQTHAGIAHERFLPAGPFALLPLTGNRSSLVWTDKAHLTPTIMALEKEAFRAEVQERAGDFLGHINVIENRRWSFPLTLQYAHSYTGPRTALVGDAGHGIHPIAGQGLNLGLRDGAALIEVIKEARNVGLDIGAPDVLGRYEEWRRFDNATLITVTDLLTRLFSNDIGPIRDARDMGMAVVNSIPPLKKFFMAHARGTVGQLPKLLAGEAL